MESTSKTLTSSSSLPATILNYIVLLLSSFLFHSKAANSAGSPLSLLLHLLRRLILLSLNLFLFLLHWVQPYPSSPSPVGPTATATATASPAERALSHVLSLLPQIPASSRKYLLLRSLADRLLDDNLLFSSASVNALSLSSAFARSIGAFESALAPPQANRGAAVVTMVEAAVRRWEGRNRCAGGETVAGGGDDQAEKMAAEVAWMAGKMAECGAVEEAVRMWGEAKDLSKAALVAQPRVQVALVRLSALLFKQANAKQFGKKSEDNCDYDNECVINSYRMALLTSWLPLLCHATNGTDMPVLSSREKAEMVMVLEEMIEKHLSRDQQEEVLALWLHHFTLNPDSDWPNLESCYTRWYSLSRDLTWKQLEQ